MEQGWSSSSKYIKKNQIYSKFCYFASEVLLGNSFNFQLDITIYLKLGT